MAADDSTGLGGGGEEEAEELGPSWDPNYLDTLVTYPHIPSAIGEVFYENPPDHRPTPSNSNSHYNIIRIHIYIYVFFARHMRLSRAAACTTRGKDGQTG